MKNIESLCIPEVKEYDAEYIANLRKRLSLRLFLDGEKGSRLPFKGLLASNQESFVLKMELK